MSVGQMETPNLKVNRHKLLTHPIHTYTFDTTSTEHARWLQDWILHYNQSNKTIKLTTRLEKQSLTSPSSLESWNFQSSVFIESLFYCLQLEFTFTIQTKCTCCAEWIWVSWNLCQLTLKQKSKWLSTRKFFLPQLAVMKLQVNAFHGLSQWVHFAADRLMG